MSASRDTPGNLTTPPSTHHSRSRRSEATSSGVSRAGTFGISNVHFRVGAPPLHLLPLQTSFDEVTSAIHERFGEDFAKEAERVLLKYGIDYYADDDESDSLDIRFITRSVPGIPETAQPTLKIVASWLEDSARTWEKVVRELKIYIDDRLLDSQLECPLLGVCVEMIAPQLTRRKYMGVIRDNPKLVSDWPEIQEKVFSILESFQQTQGQMACIALFRLGFYPNREENPPTVYVSVDYDSEEVTWPPVVRAIQTFLDKLEHNLVVHIEHNTLDTYTFELLRADEPRMDLKIVDDYQENVPLGADICASAYFTRDDHRRCNPTLGTLGCYVEVKTKSSSEWVRLALTNYHVVRPCFEGFGFAARSSKTSRMVEPAKESQLWKTDHDGFGPERARDAVPVESPSRVKHNVTVQILSDDIQECPSSAESASGASGQEASNHLKMKSQLQSKLSFFDLGRNILGQPLYGSGFGRRSSKNQRMDWALIEVAYNRHGSNLLPPFSSWSSLYPPGHRPAHLACGVSLRLPLDASLRKMKTGDKVFKVGARTGSTAGFYSEFKARCKVSDGKYMKLPPSSEYVVIGYPGVYDRPFADGGDSGAVVYNTFGQAVGLLSTGNSPQQTKGEGYTLVTPIEDVFEDIKAKSDEEIVDIRLSSY